MKRLYIFLFLTISISMVSQKLFAHDFYIVNSQGTRIYYYYNEDVLWEVWVTFNHNDDDEEAPDYNDYSGLVTIPSSVTAPNGYEYNVESIDNSAFRNCTGLEGVNIPNSVTSIYGSAFENCSSLTNLTIPSSVTWIENYAFRGCTSLTSMTVRSTTPPTIGTYAFENCNLNNATLYVPEGSKAAYEAHSVWNKFGKIDEIISFSYSNVKALCVANWDTNGDGELSVSEAEAVTSLGNVFRNNTDITCFNELRYFTGLTSIGNNAFEGCLGLLYVTLPSSVKSIGNYAFRGCYRLKSVTIPEGVTTIGEYAFYDCSKYDNSLMTDVTIPSSVNSIGFSAFGAFGTSGYVTNIKISDLEAWNGITFDAHWCDGFYLYLNEEKISDMVIPNTFTSIGNYAFRRCRLTSVEIPNSVISIGVGAFEYCPLTSVSLPNSVTSIGNNAFQGCASMTSVDIPNSVTTIGKEAFSGCENLPSIIIPNSVTTIGSYAFYGCYSLMNINIGTSVTSIGDFAFVTGCTLNGLIMTVGMDTPVSVSVSCLPNNIGHGTLYVPYGSSSAYQAADYWKEFNEIVEMPAPEVGAFEGSTDKTYTVVGAGELMGTNWEADDADNDMTSTDNENYTLTISGISVEAGSYEFKVVEDHAWTNCWPSSNYKFDITETAKYDIVYTFNATSKEITVTPTKVGAFEGSTKTYTVAGTGELMGTDWQQDDADHDMVKGDDGIYRLTLTGVTLAAKDYKYKVTVNHDWGVSYPSSDAVLTIAEAGTYDVTFTFDEFTKAVNAMVNITFADSNVKELCVANWDTDDDGELSLDEAAAVTSLGEVFRGNTEITSFDEISYFTGLTGFDDDAFNGCSGLTSFTIPSNITSIGRRAFQNCSSLTSITIPESVTDIYYHAFSYCTGITSITVDPGNGVYDSRYDCNAIIKTTANQLVAGCKNTIIPDNVTRIGNYSFVGCTGLTTITIPESVTAIGNSAFYDCSDLTSVTIPNSVTSIEAAAFYHCNSLTSVTVEMSTPFAINENVFSNRANATLFVPVGSKAAYEAADYWKQFGTIVEYGNITFADSNVKELCVANWDTDDDGELSLDEAAAVTSLGEVFRGNTEITSFDEISYFTGLTGFDDDAFNGCSGLTLFTIPSNITSIGRRAFQNCSSLTSISIPNSVTSIDEDAFGGCSNLTKLIVSDIAAWCNIAFNKSYSNPLRYAHHLYSDESTEICNLVIPEGVTSIGNNAFYGCSSLTSVSIPNNVTSIGNCAFYGCSSLTSVSIGNSVTSIGNYAFYGCSSLTSVGIPNSVTSIGLYAFSGNSSLTKVIVSDIAAWCNITIVGFQSSPLYYAHHLYSDESTEIKDLVIPEGVTSIGNNAFYGCSSLTSVSIPNSVTSIGINSFYGCSSLTSVSIPNNVTSIGNNAFSGCSSLTSVKVEKENPIGIKSGVFSNRVNATLYVPIGSKAAYEAADYWKEFGTIVEMVGLYSVNHTANRGAEFDLPVLMENGSEAITAFQFDVVLPEGVTLLSAKLSDRKADHGNPVPTLQNDGSYRLTTFSGSGSAFSGSEGTLLNLRVKVSTDAALGEHTVTLKNIELTTTSQAFQLDNRSSTITVLDVLTGDASGDGKVSIFDAVQIVNYILGNTPETFLESAADIDGNGKITIFDAVLTVNIILNQGSTNNARITTVDNEREPQ